MPEYIQRYETLTYDGTNSAEVFDFLESCFLTVSPTWTLVSEIEGVLNIEAEDNMSGTTSFIFNVGDMAMRYFSPPFFSEFRASPVVWDSSSLETVFQQVPTTVEFNVLMARVETLENP